MAKPNLIKRFKFDFSWITQFRFTYIADFVKDQAALFGTF